MELREEGKITRDQLKILLAGIATFLLDAKTAYPQKRISICRDEEDNMILDCCAAVNAGYLITGDKDLLEIDPESLKGVGLKKLKILNPRAILSEFQ